MSANLYPLPEGTKLTPGDLYAIRIPDFAGDPCAVLPYSLVKFDVPPDCMVIKATGELSYEPHRPEPETTDDMAGIHGAMPSLFEREGSDDRQRPRRGGPMTAPQAGEQSPHHNVTPQSGTTSDFISPAPAAPAAAAPAAPAAPAAAVLPTIEDFGDTPPPPAAPAKASGKKAPNK